MRIINWSFIIFGNNRLRVNRAGISFHTSEVGVSILVSAGNVKCCDQQRTWSHCALTIMWRSLLTSEGLLSWHPPHTPAIWSFLGPKQNSLTLTGVIFWVCAVRLSRRSWDGTSMRMRRGDKSQVFGWTACITLAVIRADCKTAVFVAVFPASQASSLDLKDSMFITAHKCLLKIWSRRVKPQTLNAFISLSTHKTSATLWEWLHYLTKAESRDSA